MRHIFCQIRSKTWIILLLLDNKHTQLYTKQSNNDVISRHLYLIRQKLEIVGSLSDSKLILHTGSDSDGSLKDEIWNKYMIVFVKMWSSGLTCVDK